MIYILLFYDTSSYFYEINTVIFYYILCNVTIWYRRYSVIIILPIKCLIYIMIWLLFLYLNLKFNFCYYKSQSIIYSIINVHFGFFIFWQWRIKAAIKKIMYLNKKTLFIYSSISKIYNFKCFMRKNRAYIYLKYI